MAFETTFWGVRGSIPCASPEYAIYGGNTSCVEMNFDGNAVIIDAGSGIRALGESIVHRAIKNITLMISHTHWDHICGFPFFYPAFLEESHIDVYAGRLPDGLHAKDIFEMQMSAPFFPLPMHMIPSVLHFHSFDAPNKFQICGGIVDVETIKLNHPNGATGYKMTYRGKSAAYISDTEHFTGKRREELLAFIKNCDLMIYDAMYTDEEYQSKTGWGHSTWREAAKLTQEADIKQTFLFHHAPVHTDLIMRQIEKEAQQVEPRLTVAKEGLKIVL